MGKDGMNGKPGKGTLSKRLELLERAISFRRARHIVVEIDGNNADQSEAESDTILQELAAVDADLVIFTKHYSHSGNDPDLPRLISVMNL
jgi:hypothetical protein